MEFNPEVFNGRKLAGRVFNFRVISANFCQPNEQRILTPMHTTLYLQEDGSLEYFVNLSAKKSVSGDKFCLESRVLNGEHGLVSMVCLGNEAIIPEKVSYFMFGKFLDFLLLDGRKTTLFSGKTHSFTRNENLLAKTMI